MQQEKFDLYLDGRLRIWAAWRLSSKGWPPASLLAVMLEVGSLSRSFSGSKPPVGIEHEWAEELNTLVNRMRKQRPEYADAIKARYIDLRHGQRMSDLAKARKISLSTFKQRIQGAKDWLSGRLDAQMNDPEFIEPKKSA